MFLSCCVTDQGSVAFGWLDDRKAFVISLQADFFHTHIHPLRYINLASVSNKLK